MTSTRLIWQSLRHHARAHLGVVLGAMVGSAALIGALLVGDSIRGTLRDIALARLGNTTVALDAGDRFVRAALADALSEGRAPSSPTLRCAPLLQLAGICAHGTGEARANNVHIIGVDDRILKVAPNGPTFPTNASDAVVLNTALAQHLNAKVGDEVLVRVLKPSLLSREAPITPQQDSSVALRMKVTRIVGDNDFGRFSLRASQLPPYNAFVPLAVLQRELELGDRSDILLALGTEALAAQQALSTRWQLADAELEIAPLTNSAGVELRSRRVFLDPPVVAASQSVAGEQTRILTYFVNELRAGTNTTPYSMVTGATPPFVPADMLDDQIVINQWLAEDLAAKVGDTLHLRYYVIGETRRLEERTNQFRVRTIVPLEGVYADRSLMPEFPGIAKAESTENWDAGFPIQMSKIRPKDETYWKQHRGTPKAFVTLAAGQKMWGNRFGDLTAIRYTASSNEVAAAILKHLTPASLGLRFEPVREQALAASSSGQDFGQLFLGLSFFLIAAALILMGLMFQFGLEQRITEIGTLLALGFPARQVRRIFFAEGLALAALGGLLGTAAGILYARLVLNLLTTVWRDAVAGSALQFHARPMTYGVGLIASIVIGAITIALVLRKQARQPAHELLARGAERTFTVARRARIAWSQWIAVASVLAGVALIIVALTGDASTVASIFFGAGALLLIAGIAASSAFLQKLARSATAHSLSVAAMGIRSCARRRTRSLATIALLAAGSFMIIAVAANRLEADVDSHKRNSGTGGFALIGETALPVFHDLNSADGRDFFGLSDDELKDVSFVPMRVRDGDDASCLNLNRAQQPRVLGLNAWLLNERQAFRFTETAEDIAGNAKAGEWSLLQIHLVDGAVPAIGDANSIRWALGKKIGDTLDYVDERGRPFKIRIVAAIANSILQGNLLIDERAFIERFPSESGYRMFLIDAPSNTVAEVSAALSRGLQNVGMELTPATRRLAAFNAVQNTYLSTFQVLGALGLLLGTAGLGVVVLRNVLERRGELGLLLALGYRRGLLRKLVLSEHAGLLVFGLCVGVLAALCAVAPVLFLGGGQLPYAWLLATLGATAIIGVTAAAAATAIALRGNLLAALRNE